MSDYYCNDGKDRLEDIVAAAQSTRRVDVVKSHEFAKDFRDYVWENRRISSHGNSYGDQTYQWMAHIPGRIARMLDVREPDWCDSEESLQRVMRLYPEIRMDSPGEK